MHGLTRGERREFVRDRLDELVVLEIARRREHHVAAAKASRVIVEELLLIEETHGGGCAEDGLAEGMISPEILRE